MDNENKNNNNVPKDLLVPLERKEDTSDKISRPSRTFMQDARRTFFKNKLAMLCVFILIIISIMSIVGPGMNDYGLDDQDLSRAKMPPHVPVLEKISWLGFDGTLTDEFKGKDIEEATKNAVARYGNDADFIDIKELDKGDGSAKSAEVQATYHIYEAKDMNDQYFWLGTDTLGRDQWTRLWLGTRVSLIIALVAAAIDLVIGVAYGGVSAFYGGRVDNVMQRILEVLVGIPNLVVILLMILVLQPGILSIIIALTITGWIGMARIVRGEILKLKSQEFVLAARTLGTSNGKIISRHLVPNISGIIIINTMFTIPSAIFFEAFLSFIGLGLVPPEASLGTLINTGFENLRLYPYLLVFPAVLISVIMITFNLIGDGLRDAFDPKMHK
ncbi:MULTISPECIES: oligopeptide ABC transporter permease [Virgibacillus]|uniref:ABC transporter permease n=1 Tax=Virgibacillus halodenitrificans TaxID=1482 RepID=A0AAC9J2C5_VIRHA|nr:MULTISPECIES: oligopeptide ABC transporter permease [Virgibacillus]AIF44761.1 peptide ABC transporter permease [Virgibacillus sp. SK37]APC49847.1 peptide ABC transporter permease [Virgibacillus halodenitrificans]MBD1223480.1 ABC transporter permease [Virgibacillus halodenitrificans]MEC2157919.1 ABC transporter permease [Virgibacillus halodenitrificans]MYL46117.1 ABC transporter permease subunit [Virgibacillus halodenitrificans]